MDRKKSFRNLRHKASKLFNPKQRENDKQDKQPRQAPNHEPMRPRLISSLPRRGEPPVLAFREQMGSDDIVRVARRATDALSRSNRHEDQQLEFAIIGGAAIHLFGNGRRTHDVDILVSNGTRARARARLRDYSRGFFHSQGESVWCTINGRCFGVDVIDPLAVGPPGFEIVSPDEKRVVEGGAVVIHPRKLLLLKEHSNRQRSSQHDRDDIEWLNRQMARLEQTAATNPYPPEQHDTVRQGPIPF